MDFIKKYKRNILLVLAVLGTAATITVTDVDDKLVQVATEYVVSK